MPEAFTKCIATKGSKKFTKKLPGGKYVYGCRLPGSSKAVWGEIHTKKKEKKYTKKVDKKMHDAGDIDFEKKRIRINPKKGDVVNTILHEEAHKQHPEWTEKRIKKLAKKRELQMSLKQIAKKLLRYAK